MLNDFANDLDLLTIQDLTAHFKIAQSTVYALAKKGKIPCVKVGGSVRFRPSVILSWMKSQEKTNYGRAA